MIGGRQYLSGDVGNNGKKILVVDDDEVVRAYLQSLLLENNYRVSLASSLAEVKAAALNNEYALMVTGLLFLGKPYSGLDLIEYMRRIQPKTHAIVLTSYPSADSAIKALRLKVDDYLINPVQAEILLRAVAEALPTTGREQVAEIKRVAVSLSKREEEVLALMFKGYPFVEVAEHLSCSHSTAKTYSRRIYKKLGVSSRSGAIYEALSLGLIQE